MYPVNDGEQKKTPYTKRRKINVIDLIKTWYARLSIRTQGSVSVSPSWFHGLSLSAFSIPLHETHMQPHRDVSRQFRLLLLPHIF